VELHSGTRTCSGKPGAAPAAYAQLVLITFGNLGLVGDGTVIKKVEVVLLVSRNSTL
jgi:hypothetical protein